MPIAEALAAVQSAINLTRTHRHAPNLDVLALVVRGRDGQVLDFSDSTAPNGSLAAPGQRRAGFRRDACASTRW